MPQNAIHINRFEQHRTTILPISTAASDNIGIAKSNNPEEPEYQSAI
jgi:hypothetical protein